MGTTSGAELAKAERFMAWLTELPIKVADDNSPRTFNRIYQLAHKYRISTTASISNYDP